MSPRVILIRSLALALLCAVLTGCPSGGASDSITGTVTLNGKPVSGTVTFHGDGKEAVGPLLDGKYTVANPPKGDLVITIAGMLGQPGGGGGLQPLKDKMPGGAKEAAPLQPSGTTGGAGAAPPDKYKDKGAALLKYTYKGGKQTHNIELTP